MMKDWRNDEALKQGEETILEETETGTEQGCNPSPWAPCVFPPCYTYERKYTIKRVWKKINALSHKDGNS